MRFIWATRGRTWGFRFLRDGDFADPLPEYDAAFRGAETGATVFLRTSESIAARFPDPLGRRDSAGRVIPHEFVLLAPLPERIDDLDAVRERVWPLVADEYARSWNSDPA